MQDLKAPSSVLAMQQLARPEVYKRVLQRAAERTQNRADAEDLLRDAFMRVVDPDDAPWDPAVVTFDTHMNQVMRHTQGRQKRKAASKVKLVDGVALDEAAASADRAPDDALDGRRAVERLRAIGLDVYDAAEARYPLATQCIDLSMGGVHSAREQAASIGCPVERVYDAHEFIKRETARATADWESAEQVRMAAARDRHKMRKEIAP